MRETDRPINIGARVLPYLKPSLKTDGPNIKFTHDDEPVLRKLNNDLLVAYLIDTGEQFRYIQNRDLSSAGLTEPELYERSLRNLKDFIQTRLELQPYGPVFVILLGGHFEATLLLVDELWDETFAHLAPNGFVAAIPARDLFAFCDIGSQEGIAELRAIIERAQAVDDHLITPILLRRDGRSWLRYAD